MSTAARPRLPGTRWLARSLAGAASVMFLMATPAAAFGIRDQEWPLDAQHLQSASAWDISRGHDMVVAVVDSGVDANHPDLAGQVLPGASFIGDTHDDGRTDTSKDSHGTAISGIIAGTGRSSGGTGMIGLAPDAKILPVRVGVDSSVQPTALAEGIKYAADHHAQVINVSMGVASPDPLLRQAITYALGSGAVVVAAAGNDGQNGNPPQYPGSFPGVINVTGVTQSGDFWPISESGPQTTLAAPAVNIYSTNDHGQYVNAEGTSYATAYVSAAAALVRSAHPNLTAGQTIRRLISTAKRNDGGKGHDDRLGYGIVAPLAALTAPASIDGDPANPLLAPQAARSAKAHGNRVLAIVLISAGAAVIAGVIAIIVWRKRRSASASPGDSASGTSRSAGARSSSAAKGTTKGGKTSAGRSLAPRSGRPRQKSRSVTPGRR